MLIGKIELIMLVDGCDDDDCGDNDIDVGRGDSNDVDKVIMTLMVAGVMTTMLMVTAGG